MNGVPWGIRDGIKGKLLSRYDRGSNHVPYGFGGHPNDPCCQRAGVWMISKNLIKIILIGIALMVGCAWLISSASAELTYSMNITPINDPLSPTVKQGDTIYMGKVYDFSTLAGFSREYAHWHDWREEDLNCNPDVIVDTRYWSTLTNRKAVYIDPSQWLPGNWYQWDGYECNITHYNIDTHQWESRDEPLQSDNKYAFEIVAIPKVFPEPLVTPADIVPVGAYERFYS